MNYKISVSWNQVFDPSPYITVIISYFSSSKFQIHNDDFAQVILSKILSSSTFRMNMNEIILNTLIIRYIQNEKSKILTMQNEVME